jgi:hypothetical protein
MVFSVNAVESGPQNFSAFKAKAMSQGTSTAQPTSDASIVSVSRGAGILVALVAAIAGILL